MIFFVVTPHCASVDNYRQCAYMNNPSSRVCVRALCIVPHEPRAPSMPPPHPTCEICCARPARQGGCARCGYAACRACAQRCALEAPGEPRCASCAREWDAAEQKHRLGAVFVARPLRAARRARLVARERARLADAAPLAHRETRRRALRKALRESARLLYEGGDPAQLVRHRTLVHALDALETAPRTPAGPRCAHAHCPGFLLGGSSSEDARRACGTCARVTCARCGEALEEKEDKQHVCDEAVVASREAIAAQCRPCAGCGAPSARTEGCPVMWCAHCHAFWHWDTGRLVHSGAPPHNPDHRAWLARGGAHAPREVDDVPCGGLPDDAAMQWALMREFAQHLDVHPTVPSLLDALQALRVAQRLRHAHPLAWQEARETEPLRVALLVGDVGVDEFARRLERQDRDLRYKRDVGLALEALVLAGADVFQRFCAHAPCAEVAYELEALRRVVDGALQDVGRAHGRTAPRLSALWRWKLPHQRRAAPAPPQA